MIRVTRFTPANVFLVKVNIAFGKDEDYRYRDIFHVNAKGSATNSLEVLQVLFVEICKREFSDTFTSNLTTNVSPVAGLDEVTQTVTFQNGKKLRIVVSNQDLDTTILNSQQTPIEIDLIG